MQKDPVSKAVQFFKEKWKIKVVGKSENNMNKNYTNTDKMANFSFVWHTHILFPFHLILARRSILIAGNQQRVSSVYRMLDRF